MKKFVEVVKWSYFFKIIGGIFLFLTWSKIYRPKDLEPLSWLFVISITLLFAFLLLSYAYLQYHVHRKPVILSLKEIRKKKLKKIKRIW
jgi:hypothetical protein